ncbi:MAG: ROK family protein [Ignavibacterium sp.]|nr:MAG: ROK family protein [Ignavibacterium sp.]
MAKSIISIDMGGTKVLGCIVNSKEGIVSRVKVPTDQNSSGAEYIDALATVVNEVIDESGHDEKKIVAVCLGVAGSVNPSTGVIALAPNLGLKDFNMKEALQKKIEVPILIENDVNLAALGIKNFEVGKKAKNMLAVFVGTGIGGGLIINKKIYRGSSFTAGEIGHVLVNKNGPVCGCGKRGCFEAIASRTAVVDQIINDIKSGKKSSLASYVKSGEKIKSKILSAAVNDGDKVAMKRVAKSCEVIGGVLAGLTNFMNFDMIVIGGGMIEQLKEFMLPKIEMAFNEHVLKAAAKDLEIATSELGGNAAIWGGISLAEEFLDVKV